MADLIIPSGGTLSNKLQVADTSGQGDFRISGLVMPSGWDAADLVILMDLGDNTYRAPYSHDGTTATQLIILSADVVANRPYTFAGNLALAGACARAVQLQASAAQNGGARTFTTMLTRYPS